MQPLTLKPGVEPERAAAVLHALAVGARDAATAGHEWHQVRDAYLQWVETVELQLASLTADLAVVAAVQNEHYWRLQDASARFARPIPMMTAELARQQGRFESLAADLKERRERLAKAPGSIVVIDTHVLLHYQAPAHIPWPDVVGSTPVRLVVPLRVVEELDLKKWGENKRLASRARDVLPGIRRTVGPGGTPGRLRDNVTVEVPVPSRPRQRPPDADEEILATCDELAAFAGKVATLITGDTSMTIRAEAAGIAVAAMPDRFERKQTTPPAPATR
jgi:hypothetical protein